MEACHHYPPHLVGSHVLVDVFFHIDRLVGFPDQEHWLLLLIIIK